MHSGSQLVKRRPKVIFAMFLTCHSNLLWRQITKSPQTRTFCYFGIMSVIRVIFNKFHYIHRPTKKFPMSPKTYTFTELLSEVLSRRQLRKNTHTDSFLTYPDLNYSNLSIVAWENGEIRIFRIQIGYKQEDPLRSYSLVSAIIYLNSCIKINRE